MAQGFGLRVSYALVGESLEPVGAVCIEVYDDGVIGIGSSCGVPRVIDLRGFVALPPLCNGHLHVMDSAIPEYGEGSELSELVSHPHGLKYRLLASTPLPIIRDSVLRTFKRVLSEGVLFTGVYAELGLKGAKLVTDLYASLGIEGRVLAQPITKSVYEYLDVARMIGGIGFDTVFDIDSHGRRLIAILSRTSGWIVHVHVSETRELYEARDYEYIDELAPTAFIHGIYMDVDELASLLDQGYSWIICPRSNTLLAKTSPPLAKAYWLWRKGYRSIGLGTDNAAWIPPSIGVELEYSYILYAWRSGDPEDYARMLIHTTTLGCYRALGLPPSVLESGVKLGAIVLAGIEDIEYSGAPLSTIVKRLSTAHQVKIVRQVDEEPILVSDF